MLLLLLLLLLLLMKNEARAFLRLLLWLLGMKLTTRSHHRLTFNHRLLALNLRLNLRSDMTAVDTTTVVTKTVADDR